MIKIFLLVLGAAIGWLIGIHFWIIFKLAGIALGGYLCFGSIILYGFSGNAEGSDFFAWIGIPLIIAIISGWIAISENNIDSIPNYFSVEKVRKEKVDSNNNLAETLKQLEEAGIITINKKK